MKLKRNNVKRLSLQTPIRVTSVLNFFHEDWYIDWVLKVGKREANRIKKAAMKVGSEVDEIIKANIGGTYLPEKFKSDEVKNCIEAYKKWYKTYTPTTMKIGERLNLTFDGVDITGEPDIFVDDVLVDIKCASKVSPSYWVQVNMYAFMHGGFEKVGILRLDKTTGSYEYIVQNVRQDLVSVWFGLLKAYVYYKGESDGGLSV